MKFSPTQRAIGLWLALILVLCATMAMAAEPRLIAAIFVQGKVGLKWTTMPGVEEYTVYRKAAGEDFQSVASVPEGQWFDETIAQGTAYTYRIGAVVDGNEVFSGEKSVNIPAAVTGFSAPTWVGARVDGPRIMLNWDPVPSAVAYNIFRSTTAGGPYESIASSQANRYADTDGLEPGAEYYYVLTALNAEFEETPQSEEQPIRFGKTAEEIEAANANRVELVPLTVSALHTIERPGQLEMNQPSDVFVAPSGDVYVVDSLNGQVLCFAPDEGFKFAFGRKMRLKPGDPAPDGAFGIALTLFIDKKGEVYVSDVMREDIQVFSASGDFLRKITVEPGEGFTGLRANGMHVFDDGSLVVTDTGNHRVLFLDPQGIIEKSIGQRGVGPGEFNFPSELVVTPQNEIFIVDIHNNRIVALDIEGNFLRAFGESGQSAGTFGRPSGIAVGPEGNIWVTDKMSGMVQKFSPEGEILSALGTIKDEVRFGSPHGICFQGSTLYVVNRLGNKVSVLTLQ